MKLFNRYYLLIIIILTLSTIAVYSTYAMFTSTVETDDIVNMDTTMNYTFDINGTQELKVSKGSKLRFNAIVKNSMTGTISYGLYYKMINPSTIPEEVIIAQVSDDLTFLAKGQLESGMTTIVPLVIKNNSNTDITVQIGVRTGYANNNQGVDDIIYNNGEIPITSFQTSEEAGNDSCNATMKCTTECTNKLEGGFLKEVCYCYTGKEVANPYKTSSEMLQYLGLTANEGTPDFSKIATTDEGIYSTEDDYGTSYYFRGAVTNNYVKFANKFWRIIRINGDGTIRMIYDGTTAHNNGESSADRQVSISSFNNFYDSNAYIGYMYGNPNANTYEETHKNANNSLIKTTVDNWYKTNIEDKGFSDKIADVIYCNDRSLKIGLGIGENETYYKAYSRIVDNVTPALTCPQQNDSFTVSDIAKGNGNLTYPVGLLTIDETEFAGINWGVSSNNRFYLYTGQYFWTMSPTFFFGRYATEYAVDSFGTMNRNDDVTYKYGVRPVISLKSDVTISGLGTKESPFLVS